MVKLLTKDCSEVVRTTGSICKILRTSSPLPLPLPLPTFARRDEYFVQQRVPARSRTLTRRWDVNGPLFKFHLKRASWQPSLFLCSYILRWSTSQIAIDHRSQQQQQQQQPSLFSSNEALPTNYSFNLLREASRGRFGFYKASFRTRSSFSISQREVVFQSTCTVCLAVRQPAPTTRTTCSNHGEYSSWYSQKGNLGGFSFSARSSEPATRKKPDKRH